MLETLGLKSVEELYAHLPDEVRLKKDLEIPDGKSEYEIAEAFQIWGARNAAANVSGHGYASFLGAGVYHHYRPILVDTVVSRGEFLTAYTPYQAEISQGTLTSIFEFQTMLCQLTGMEVANASMYDGSTAVTEAALMAMRITRRGKVAVARTLHPEYREVLATYLRHVGDPITEFGFDADTGQVDLTSLEASLSEQTAAVIVQSPNFFGIVEQIPQIAEIVHARGALLIFAFTEAVSLGLLRPPKEADIVAGELQSFAIAPSYGGPYAGIISCKEKFVRQMPGRLVGETKDIEGERAFCMTLVAREQHIRREKATSNICTNQALVALMATVFMTVYGKHGLRELAEQNLSKAHYLGGKLKRRFSGPYFNEFAAETGSGGVAEINRGLESHGIIGGLPLERFYPELGGCMLLCCTEMTRREDMDLLASGLEKMTEASAQ